MENKNKDNELSKIIRTNIKFTKISLELKKKEHNHSADTEISKEIRLDAQVSWAIVAVKDDKKGTIVGIALRLSSEIFEIHLDAQIKMEFSKEIPKEALTPQSDFLPITAIQLLFPYLNVLISVNSGNMGMTPIHINEGFLETLVSAIKNSFSKNSAQPQDGTPPGTENRT